MWCGGVHVGSQSSVLAIRSHKLLVVAKRATLEGRRLLRRGVQRGVHRGRVDRLVIRRSRREPRAFYDTSASLLSMPHRSPMISLTFQSTSCAPASCEEVSVGLRCGPGCQNANRLWADMHSPCSMARKVTQAISNQRADSMFWKQVHTLTGSMHSVWAFEALALTVGFTIERCFARG